MPELPEAEASRRLLDRVLAGKTIIKAHIAPDDIVLSGAPAAGVEAMATRAVVESVGRRGKYMWLNLKDRGILGLHLGMSGSIIDLSQGADAAVNYRQNKGGGTGEDGLPKYIKLHLITADSAVCMVDPRRLARIWTADSPETDPRMAKLGPDAWLDLPRPADFHKLLRKRKTPIKALLLHQSFLAGIGNWVADEVLYHGGIAPARLANSLDTKESESLHKAIKEVLDLAVKANADHTKFPSGWMFHHRWGGGRGADLIEGQTVVRETIGGRTTAWVPSRQK